MRDYTWGHGNLDAHKRVAAIEYSEMRAALFGRSENQMQVRDLAWQMANWRVHLSIQRPILTCKSKHFRTAQRKILCNLVHIDESNLCFLLKVEAGIR